MKDHELLIILMPNSRCFHWIIRINKVYHPYILNSQLAIEIGQHCEHSFERKKIDMMTDLELFWKAILQATFS